MFKPKKLTIAKPKGLIINDEKIRKALDGYWERTNNVMDVLRLASLNNNGIEKIIHIGERFLIIDTLLQKSGSMVSGGIIENMLSVPAELIQTRNPHLPDSHQFYNDFVDMSLDLEEKRFVMVAYEEAVWDYVIRQTTAEQEFGKGKLLKTKKDVPFYLVRENDVNSLFPLRFSIKL